MSKMSKEMKKNIEQDLLILVFAVVAVIITLQIPADIMGILLFGGSVATLLFCGIFSGISETLSSKEKINSKEEQK